MRPRLLSVLIIAGVAMLGFRVGDIWQGLGRIAQASSQAEELRTAAPLGIPELQSLEEAVPSSVVQIAQAPAPEAAQADGGQENGVQGNTGNPTSTAAVNPADPSLSFDEEAAARVISADPLNMSDEEIEILQQLAQRRAELDRRARELDEREDLLRAAEARLEDKVAALQSLQITIEEQLVDYDEQQEAQLTRLVTIYENMKPREAARIFEQLEMDIVLRVLERMRERRSAPILAEMRPDRAQMVTLELAERRELPLPRE